MRIETHGQQIEVTPALRDYVETKLERLRGISTSHSKSAPSWAWTSPTTAPRPPSTWPAAPCTPMPARIDMYAAIDLLADKLDRLLIKHKEKMVDHHRGESAARSGEFT